MTEVNNNGGRLHHQRLLPLQFNRSFLLDDGIIIIIISIIIIINNIILVIIRGGGDDWDSVGRRLLRSPPSLEVCLATTIDTRWWVQQTLRLQRLGILGPTLSSQPSDKRLGGQPEQGGLIFFLKIYI